MKLILSPSARNALNKIKDQMIKQFEEKDINRFKIKFTKKKEFLAVPIPYTGPAFQLYINDKFLRTYFFKKGKWMTL